MASRPWRDGQDVLKVAMGHLPDVFVVTPSGSLLAPTVVELQLNPPDLASLCERMELGVISSTPTAAYEGQAAGDGARPPRPERGRAGGGWRGRGGVPWPRAAIGCGRAIRCGPAPGLTWSRPSTRTPCPSSRTPPRSTPTPGRSATSGRTLARRSRPA